MNKFHVAGLAALALVMSSAAQAQTVKVGVMLPYSGVNADLGTQIDKANAGLIDALVASGLAKSKSEARTFIQSGSVSINGNKAEGLEHVIGGDELLYGRFTILRRGKKNYGLISWQ